MEEATDEFVQSNSAKVRDLIFAYERQTSSLETLEGYEGRRFRSKSIGNALSYKLFRQPNLEIHNIVDIEKELVKIEAHLNYYEVYEKETHVAFQEQLFSVLTNIVSIDPDGHDSTIKKKRELIEETQKLAKILNLKLPLEGNTSYKGARRAYSNIVRREEAVVSTTSARTQLHKSKLSSSQSTLNSGFKSEESLDLTVNLNSTSQEEASSFEVHQSSEQEELVTSVPEEPVVAEAKTSSVSKLRKFFSFRKETSENIIPSTYSGIVRSQSLNLKTSKYKVNRKDKERTINENDELKQVDDEHFVVTSSPIKNQNGNQDEHIQHGQHDFKSEESLTLDELRTDNHNLSVTKLKTLFEDNRRENEEGLGLLTKKQTQLSSDFNLPYTEANLGAFRLKRTLSGHYMNFTGLLRNVDVKKKVDLSKSKSLSDLESEHFRYGTEGNHVDLINELDDVDDFEQVSSNADKERDEVNNNGVEEEVLEPKSEVESASVSRNDTEQSADTFIIGKVGLLRKAFEIQNSATTEYKSDYRQSIHRTIGPIPLRKDSSEEPILKVPIRLRIESNHLSNSEEYVQEATSKDLRQTITKNIESNVNSLEKTQNNVPIRIKSFTNNSEYLTVSNGNSSHRKLENPKIISGAPIKESSLEGTITTDVKNEQKVNNSVSIGVFKYGIEDSQRETYEVFTNRENVLDASDSFENISDPIGVAYEEPAGITGQKTIVSNGSVEVLKHSFESFMEEDASSTLARSKQNTNITTGIVGVLRHSFDQSIKESSLDANKKETDEIIYTSATDGVKHNFDNSLEENTLSTAILSEKVKNISTGIVDNLRHSFEDSHQETFVKTANYGNSFIVLTNSEDVSNQDSATSEKHEASALSTIEAIKQNFEKSLDKNTSSSAVINEEDLNISAGVVQNLKQSFEDSHQSTLVTTASYGDSVIVSNNSTDISKYSGDVAYKESAKSEEDEASALSTIHAIKQNFGKSIEVNTSPSPVINEEDLNISAGVVQNLKHSFEDSHQSTLVTTASYGNSVIVSSNSTNISKYSEDVSNKESVTSEEDETSALSTIDAIKQNFEKSTKLNTSSPAVINEEDLNISAGIVESLKNSFEDSQQSSFVTTTSYGNSVVLSNNSTNISKYFGDTSSQESSLKVNENKTVISKSDVEAPKHDLESLIIETTSSIPVKNEENGNISTGIVEVLRRSSVETSSDSNSQENPTTVSNTEVKIESKNISDESSLNGSSNLGMKIMHVSESTGTSSREIIQTSQTTNSLETNTQEVISDKLVLKAPIELRINDDVVLYDTSGHSSSISSAVPISLYGGIQSNSDTTVQDSSISTAVPISLYSENQSISESSQTKEDKSMSRAEIENKTQSFMKILESPTSYSSLVTGSSSQSQHVSSSSKVSVSYSEKRTVQHTSSTHVSQRTVSSLSQASELSSQKYLQVLKNSSMSPLLSTSTVQETPEDDTVTITEVEDDVPKPRLKVNLNVSQENIIEEILNDGGELDNVDEEFEKMLQEIK